MQRSVRYNELAQMVDKEKLYTPEEAMALVKKASKAKFVPSVEVHIRLNMNLKKTDEQIRGAVVLPNGTGKTKKVAVFAEGNDADNAKKAGADFVGAEDLIDELAKTGVVNFD
ncbi:MAG: 50S ribosomal protein L1, partial [Patescibacteria group bacterium]